MTDQIAEPRSRLLDQLVSFAIKRGLSEESAEAGREMHTLLDLCDPPVGYVRRLRTVKAISNLVSENAKLTDYCPELARWSNYVEGVLAEPDAYAADLPFDEPAKKRFFALPEKDPLMSRGARRHGLEALLWLAVEVTDEVKYTKLLLLQVR